MYSNTGGQSSKASPTAAVAKFSASRKRTKKNLGLIATTYGYVYVAQVALGASFSQTLKAIKEAEAYHGPSLIIAYAPYINHRIRAAGGIENLIAEEKKAAEMGYWHLWRYNPELKKQRKKSVCT